MREQKRSFHKKRKWFCPKCKKVVMQNRTEIPRKYQVWAEYLCPDFLLRKEKVDYLTFTSIAFTFLTSFLGSFTSRIPSFKDASTLSGTTSAGI